MFCYDFPRVQSVKKLSAGTLPGTEMRLWTAAGIELQAVSGCLPECSSAVWRWPLLRCWTVFLFLPEESLSATGWAGPFWGWQRKDQRVTVLFCHRTASDRAISKEILPGEQAHK